MDEPAVSSTQLREVDLRARLIDGDPAALALAYDLHSAAVHAIARRVTSDNSRAEEVTQDVFVYLWENPEKFDPQRGVLRAFLGMVARRRAIDAVRSQVAREARENRFATDESFETTPEETVLAKLDSSWAHESLKTLPPEQRDCLVLAYFAGLTFRDVAARLGIPEGTAKSRIRLALQKLKSLLDSSAVIDPATLVTDRTLS